MFEIKTRMNRFFCYDWLQQAACNFWQFATGIFSVIIGYFLPISNIVHLVLFFFLLDIIFGAWAAKKTRGERFSTKIIWKYTMPRILISLVLIITSYMWDTTFHQEILSTYKLIGWFISGVLIYSIAKNGYKITKWRIFPDISSMIEHRIEDATGIDIDKNN